MMEKSKIVELLETIPFFAEFNAKEKDYVAGLEAQVLRFRPADIIIKEGDIDKAFYVVLKGAVFVSKKKPHDVVLAKLRTGSVFGEIAYVGKRARTTYVIADGDVIALKINLSEIDTLDPMVQSKIKDQLIGILADRLNIMNDQAKRFA
ncbi:MAG: cyclic nucleotide-binding domain-containing protein [Candidatus Nitrohelix vancouverensis]|uniref:Cyclic nucleotide-binding domain-containing protein n=1 Tax=Candidatus Nitrohelix vancouverensis TaxID=2705534 RepID=A0A7T0G3I9_9BACT|nr:MAG: cyclic nucleotide-binding domain-containing protein [Candidatus Nitrohelix vancouverensis]